MNIREKLAWFFALKSVRYAQIFIVVMGDLLSLANLYPKHSMFIARPFLHCHEIDWSQVVDKKQNEDEDDDDDTVSN